MLNTIYLDIAPLVQPSDIFASVLRSNCECRISPSDRRISSFHRLYLNIQTILS